MGGATSRKGIVEPWFRPISPLFPGYHERRSWLCPIPADMIHYLTESSRITGQVTRSESADAVGPNKPFSL